jgi:pyruvate,orthophosphate dikinase
MTQWVYNFGKTGTDGDATRRNLLGGKGANLAEMSWHWPAGSTRIYP